MTAAGLKAAINANSTVAALGLVCTEIINLGVDDQRLILEARGSTAIADITISQSGDGINITKVNAADGAGFRQSVVKHTATATTALINTGLDSVDNVVVTVRTAAGAAKAYDGAVTISDTATGRGGYIFLDASGDTDIASTDVITVVAYGK